VLTTVLSLIETFCSPPVCKLVFDFQFFDLSHYLDAERTALLYHCFSLVNFSLFDHFLPLCFFFLYFPLPSWPLRSPVGSWAMMRSQVEFSFLLQGDVRRGAVKMYLIFMFFFQAAAAVGGVCACLLVLPVIPLGVFLYAWLGGPGG